MNLQKFKWLLNPKIYKPKMCVWKSVRVCVSSVSCNFLAPHGSLYGPSLEIISFFAERASLSSGCAVNQAGDWDYCRMCSHECMGLHLIKVCTDNCYYLISTIWKETVLIRGFDWVVERRETNVCFVAQYESLRSGVYVSAELEGFCVPNFDEVLVSGPVPSLSLGKYPCVPLASKLISRPSELKQCTALKTWEGRLKVLYLYVWFCCLHGKLLKMHRLVFQKGSDQTLYLSCYVDFT